MSSGPGSGGGRGQGDVPDRVGIVEVGPRDGLQNAPELVPFHEKLAFISALADAGLREIEVGSFVRPDRVPQMADTDQLCGALDLAGEVLYVALVANQRGLQRALACGVREIAVFTAASEAFTQANIGMSVDQSLARFQPLIEQAIDAGLSVRGYVSTAWWCPFSGRVSPGDASRVTERLLAAGCREVSLADTIGAATPGEVRTLLASLGNSVGADRLAVHLHDTRGTALANVLAALEVGIRAVDASAGGLGGCPFAPGAQGNLATEDLVFMLDGMGVETGVDIGKLCQASLAMEQALGRKLPSRYLRAGPLVPLGSRLP